MEVFRIINDVPKYEVSSYGRIRDIKTKCIVQFHTKPDGYYMFKGKRVNRLVALAFFRTLLINHLLTIWID